MPESRDRLIRPDPTASLFVRRRSAADPLDMEQGGRLFGSPARISNGDGRVLFGSPLRFGDGGAANLFGSPSRLGSSDGRDFIGFPISRGTARLDALPERTARVGATVVSRGVNIGRAAYGTPRSANGRGRISHRSPLLGRQNTPAARSGRSRGRAATTPLPSWCPRRPLRDITSIIRAVERRNARLREAESQRLISPSPQELNIHDSNLPVSCSPLEHSLSVLSPNQVANKACPPPVGYLAKSLLGIDNQVAGGSDVLTPQKKLLNSIDQVEKVVMEEFRRLKRTPTAKKAERENKVRTLMAMR
ncbi:PREDICTED: protein POLYCHOME [Nelumbo nucifera]|uniref:Protein POLYCHOME-like n=2 Tax=Nelumbo nucifera TaxID=4432 RepID=A0A822YKK0_NELNU|nr:PREDICTED: protein POLYCHOME [Nelumbo nucifera]DAD29878.1 TPA_asm: hypothetical protein HUJ06_031346 [Nelumbo nucifera]